MKKIIFLILSVYAFMVQAQENLYNHYNGLKINEFYIGELGFEEFHWIEFYNQSNHTIDLKGLYLTSSKSELTMFELEEHTKIDSGQFVRIFLNKVPNNNEQTAFVNVNNYENYFAISYQSSDTKFIIDEINYTDLLEGRTYVNATVGRYPDGDGLLLVMRTPTPEAPNAGQIANAFYTSEGLLGIKAQYGMNFSRLFNDTQEISYTLTPHTAHSLGVYYRLNTSYFLFAADVIYTKRAYSYQYEITNTTSKATYTKETKGRQKVGALEIGLSMGVNLTQKVNVFLGGNMGITVMSKYQYKQTTNAEIFKKDEQGNPYTEKLSDVYEAPKESNYSSADILKINTFVGLRYEMYPNLHLTFTQYSDIVGMNLTDENFARTVKFRTFLLGVEVPITMGKTKARSIF